MKKKRGYYSISAVADIFSVHQQTIRLYEKEGLIRPKRSEGNTRLFSEEDIEKLEQIIYLTHELGINLAGVEMVLQLQKKIKKLQKELNKVFDAAQEQLSEESNRAKIKAKSSAQKLLQLRQQGERLQIDAQKLQNQDETIFTTDTDNEWHLDYEE